MNELFQRAWRFAVSLPSDPLARVTLESTNLRASFTVVKTLEKTPNTMDLRISNLSELSRDSLVARGMGVTLEAGYQDSRAVIFSGTSRICDHSHEGPDWETRIQCGDGEEVISKNDRFLKSYSSGQSFENVIKDVAQAMGVNTGNLSLALTSGGLPFSSFEHGVAFAGSVYSVFNDLMKTAGFTWSIQQGALQLIKKGDQLVEEAVVLNAASGLIGSPEHTAPHNNKKPSYLTARCLLNPRIRPGCTIRMDSVQVKGDFIVHKVTHSGDTHGTEWSSKFEALASNRQTGDLDG